MSNFNINGDIRNINEIEKATEEMNIILHLAAIAGVGEYYKNPKKVIEQSYNAREKIVKDFNWDDRDSVILSIICGIFRYSVYLFYLVI